MRYFELVTYVNGGDYETHSKLIDEPTFRKYQKAVVEGKTHLVLEDRIIKMSSIKEIMPADDIVLEHLKTGISLKTLGLKETPALEGERKSTFRGGGFQKIEKKL